VTICFCKIQIFRIFLESKIFCFFDKLHFYGMILLMAGSAIKLELMKGNIKKLTPEKFKR